MADRSITAANAVIQIGVDVIFPTPVQLQGFSTNDIYGINPVKPNDTRMGVDGKLSAGKIWQAVPVVYHFQADSESCDFFDQWKLAEDAQVDTFRSNGLILLPGLSKKFTLQRGALTNWTPAPPAGTVLNERTFEITWERIIPANS
jgi:hypothetical protein